MDDYDVLWRMVREFQRSYGDESSVSETEADNDNIHNATEGIVYGFPSSFYPSAGNGQADGYPASLYPHAGNRAFPMVSRRNPSFLPGRGLITCIAYAAMLCSIVCFSMAFRVYKNGSITIGMGSSVLLQPNRFLVENINVEQHVKNNVGPTLYGFNKKPHLDISGWLDVHCAYLQANSHKTWMYFLNEGSQINVTYSAVSSSKLLITIRRASDGYGHDNGDGYCYASDQCLKCIIQQNILLSGNYYITVENLKPELEKVELKINGRSLVYNTDEAHYTCKLAQGRCVFDVLLLEENHVLLSAPQFNQETWNGEWRVKLAYGPRWITFYVGIDEDLRFPAMEIVFPMNVTVFSGEGATVTA
ncbi:E3 ubiquitin-protein ligase APD2-like [Bidens hawaiensis]|uniref:E3 ubiquitin-protein ligase APD2-like n=1 Tax=Bidens hawaiensis TaxID=980011 RepID=UPI00404AA22E